MTPTTTQEGFSLAGNIITAAPNTADNAPARTWNVKGTAPYEDVTYLSVNSVMQESNLRIKSRQRIGVGDQIVQNDDTIRVQGLGDFELHCEMDEGGWKEVPASYYSLQGTGLYLVERPLTLQVREGATGTLIPGGSTTFYGTTKISITYPPNTNRPLFLTHRQAFPFQPPAIPVFRKETVRTNQHRPP